MPPGAPWWAYLIPVGIDLVKGLIVGGADKGKQAVEEAKRRHKRSQEDRMSETNVPNPSEDD